VNAWSSGVVNVTALVDGPLNISCNVTAPSVNDTAPLVVWKKRNATTGVWRRVLANENIDLSVNGLLGFKRLLSSHAGLYQCTDRNNTIHYPPQTLLVVHAAALIIPPGLRDMTVAYGNTVKLVCEVVGIPLPFRSWTQDGIPIIDPLTQMTYSQPALQFTAQQNVTVSCMAENVHIGGFSNVSSSAFIHVVDGWCDLYRGSVCNSVVGQEQVYIKASVTLSAVDGLIESLLSHLDSLSTCYLAAKHLLCSHFFPVCTSSSQRTTSVCRENCVAVTEVLCNDKLSTKAKLEHVVNCSNLPLVSDNISPACNFFNPFDIPVTQCTAVNVSWNTNDSLHNETLLVSVHESKLTSLELIIIVSFAAVVTLIICVLFIVIYKQQRVRLKHTNGTNDNFEPDVNIDLLPSNDQYRQSVVLVTMTTCLDDKQNSFLQRFEYRQRNEIVFLSDIAPCAFGRVFKAKMPINSDTKEIVAVKMLRDDVTNDVRCQFVHNAAMLATLGHPNILRLMAVCLQRPPLCIILEYMDCGDLREYLQQRDPDRPDRHVLQLSYVHCLKIAIHVTGALTYLTSEGFVHRDVASRNFLVSESCTSGGDSSSREPLVKLSDFMLTVRTSNGVCQCSDDSEALPVRWMSPEAITTGLFSQASDVWAFGVFLWELFSYSRQPFSDIDSGRVAKHVCSGGTLPRPHDMPDFIFNLMQHCWHREPCQRPTFDQLLNDLFTEHSQHVRQNNLQLLH